MTRWVVRATPHRVITPSRAAAVAAAHPPPPVFCQATGHVGITNLLGAMPANGGDGGPPQKKSFTFDNVYGEDSTQKGTHNHTPSKLASDRARGRVGRGDRAPQKSNRNRGPRATAPRVPVRASAAPRAPRASLLLRTRPVGDGAPCARKPKQTKPITNGRRAPRRARKQSTNHQQPARDRPTAARTTRFSPTRTKPKRNRTRPNDRTIEPTQKGFYEESCYPLVENVMEGYNGTIFAYGQTGCGKTFTMQVVAPSRYFGLRYTGPARRPATPETPLCPHPPWPCEGGDSWRAERENPSPQTFLFVGSFNIGSERGLARSLARDRKGAAICLSCRVVSCRAESGYA